MPGFFPAFSLNKNMKKLVRFGEYVQLREWAKYGFENPSASKPTGGTQIPDDATPIDPINCETIMKELSRLPLGTFKPRWSWQDIMEWGDQAGAIKIDVSPLGSYKIIARRKIKDIQGEDTWVCKKVFPLNENEHNNNEIPLAHSIYDDLVEINKTLLEGPKREFPEFERLVEKLTSAVRQNYPSYCMFPKGLKKMNEDYFKIYFEFKGHGVEAPTRGRAEQFDIDVLWDRNKGLVRIWGYDIDSKVRQHTWNVQPSEFDEWFSPSQPPEEIVKAVVNMFMTY